MPNLSRDTARCRTLGHWVGDPDVPDVDAASAADDGVVVVDGDGVVVVVVVVVDGGVVVVVVVVVGPVVADVGVVVAAECVGAVMFCVDAAVVVEFYYCSVRTYDPSDPLDGYGWNWNLLVPGPCYDYLRLRIWSHCSSRNFAIGSCRKYRLA